VDEDKAVNIIVDICMASEQIAEELEGGNHTHAFAKASN
jgi:hypothetical protein